MPYNSTPVLVLHTAYGAYRVVTSFTDVPERLYVRPTFSEQIPTGNWDQGVGVEPEDGAAVFQLRKSFVGGMPEFLKEMLIAQSYQSRYQDGWRKWALYTEVELKEEYPLVTQQEILDSGINVFGLQLMLKSLPDSGDKLRLETKYRGKYWQIHIHRIREKE